ncbi:hypothetical protein BpHYR1_029012 [Brachionus plicatilis]|uniref:Uncharacterized protein n=1 Tax=Brachionus plicatilis TaxID=10195 RepID=A0A3M7SW34_BRAPC|nr:hypothetical protein BpHYR1_029012 [Brachionus plicatilis]
MDCTFMVSSMSRSFFTFGLVDKQLISYTSTHFLTATHISALTAAAEYEPDSDDDTELAVAVDEPLRVCASPAAATPPKQNMLQPLLSSIFTTSTLAPSTIAAGNKNI